MKHPLTQSKKILTRAVCAALTVLFLLTALSVSALAATIYVGSNTVKTCAYLNNGAVYMADQPLPVWGTATVDGTEIQAELRSGTRVLSTATATVTDGRWELELDGQAASYTPYTVRIYIDGLQKAEYSDILFGEVWLAAGQSNMQYQLKNAYGREELLETADDAYLRMFTGTAMPSGSGASPQPAADIGGAWAKGDSPNSLKNVSAVAYSFARTLRGELDVPVAVVDISLGSTSIACWLSHEMVEEYPTLKQELVKRGIYKETPIDYRDFSASYNDKLAPLTRLSIRGLIWYQGESDTGRGDLYDEQLDVLKQEWGELFGFENDSMPMVFCQPTPYAWTTSASREFAVSCDLKDSMQKFYLAHQDTTSMVTLYDLSLRYQDTDTGKGAAVIHPSVKIPVGERMALGAMGLCYGGAEATAPTVKQIEQKNGKFYITFDHIGDGLTTANDSYDLQGFAISTGKGTWVNATAEFYSFDTVVVYSPYMTDPKYVCYAWNDMCTDANLCASSGIGAAPFCTGGTGGPGSRSYLNCDSDIFVVDRFDSGEWGTGHAAYMSPWDITAGCTVAFDSEERVQGTSSLRVDHSAGEAKFGMDLSVAGMYSYTTHLNNINSLAVQMKNPSSSDVSVTLYIGTSTGHTYHTQPQTLRAGADFEALVFDLTTLTYAQGEVVKNTTHARKYADQISFVVQSEQEGTLWVDAIQLGTVEVDGGWVTEQPSEQPDTPIEPTEPTEPVEPTPANNGNALVIVVAVCAAVIVAAAVAVAVVLLKKK